MILVDLNQVMISNLMMQLKNSSGELSEDMVRHMVLSSLRLYRNKFLKDYGELVICCDDKDYWRKHRFPYYKASRKKDREQSSIDWNAVFTALNNIRDEIRDNMPYKVVQVPHAEADDIIATLCGLHGAIKQNGEILEPILILSGDKDFVQLQKYVNVDIYSPVQKKFNRVDNPERFLREHIMLGDRGDGVPNFLSPDDTFVEGKRQRPISRKKLSTWAELDPQDFCDERMLRGYMRNKTLVDLSEIPPDIKEQILHTYNSAEPAPRSNIMNYFMEKRLKRLMENVQAF